MAHELTPAAIERLTAAHQHAVEAARAALPEAGDPWRAWAGRRDGIASALAILLAHQPAGAPWCARVAGRQP